MSLTAARELAVLSVLIAHPAHGYQVAAAFEEGPLQLLGLKRAAVYAILSRFSDRGWINEEDEAGGPYPDRRVSYVTELGRDAIDELADRSGGLSQTPIMALMLLHDSGVDVIKPALVQHALRRKVLAKLLDADSTHANSASHRLALAMTEAEIAHLEHLLKDGLPEVSRSPHPKAPESL